MRRSKSEYKGKMEYRIICSGQGEIHLFHAYPKPNFVKASEAAAKNNNDPVFDVPIPALRGCVPWYVESRLIGPWVNPLDGTAPRP